ncbi:MAG: glycosyltransferase family 4 protein [Atribacterota bacterium]|nr:glycosyltransferase family 4 protein [Atribacterota bacterium]
MDNNIKTICMLTSVHNVFDVRIFHREAMTLAKEGYKVTLIAPHSKSEHVEGIDIIALVKPKNRFSRMFILIWKIYLNAKKMNADIYHFHDPELILIGILLSMNGKRVIYDVHEDLPRQLISKEWIPKKLRRIISHLVKYIEAFGAKRFSTIITASEEIYNRFLRYNSKTVMVRNYPILSEILVKSIATVEKNGGYNELSEKTITSLGGIHPDRCIKEIIEAMGLLPSGLGTKLIVAGNCNSKSLLDEISILPGWKCVNYCGVLGRSEAMGILQKAKVALIIYSPALNHFEVRSNRLFEAMASGVPVVTSNFPLWRELVEGVSCGLCVDPLNPQEIAKAIEYIIDHPVEARQMGENGRKVILHRYNWEIESEKLLELYQGIL